MQTISKHNGIIEYQLTKAEWKELMISLTGATLSQTYGPNWKDIYWSPFKRAYVKK